MKKLSLILFLLSVSACSDEKPNNSYAYTATELTKHLTFKKIKDDLSNYAVGLVASTKKNIFAPTVKEERSGYYVIEFQTSDPHFMLQDVDKDPKAYDRNNAMNAAWESKFCSQELKSIIDKQNTAMIIEGVILDSKQKNVFLARQAIAKCDGSNATTSEIMNREIQNNLNTLANQETEINYQETVKATAKFLDDVEAARK